MSTSARLVRKAGPPRTPKSSIDSPAPAIWNAFSGGSGHSVGPSVRSNGVGARRDADAGPGPCSVRDEPEPRHARLAKDDGERVADDLRLAREERQRHDRLAGRRVPRLRRQRDARERVVVVVEEEVAPEPGAVPSVRVDEGRYRPGDRGGEIGTPVRRVVRRLVDRRHEGDHLAPRRCVLEGTGTPGLDAEPRREPVELGRSARLRLEAQVGPPRPPRLRREPQPDRRAAPGDVGPADVRPIPGARKRARRS